MTNPAQPLPVSGYVRDNSENLITSGSVSVKNETLGTEFSVNIQPDGSYLIDLANDRLGYNIGDKITITARTKDGRYGIFRKAIASSDTEWEYDLYVDYHSDLENLIEDTGEDIIIRTVTETVDSDGKVSTLTSDFISTCIVLEVDANSLEYENGVLEIGDIIVWISINDVNKNKAIPGNKIIWNSTQYKIVNVIHEKDIDGLTKFSHYEIHAKRITPFQ